MTLAPTLTLTLTRTRTRTLTRTLSIQATFAYGGTFGEDRNVTAAAEWWARAADGESPYAQLWLATLYANGEGADL